MSKITKEDMGFIYDELSDIEKEKLKDKKMLITGYAGSLGYSLLHFFYLYGEKLKVKKIYGIDNYILGKPLWVNRIIKNPIFDLRDLDVTNCSFDFAEDADIIFHMASLASPIYYRQFPIETIDANVIGLRRLLDFYKNKDIKGFLFYSSSEVYGDPQQSFIPTPESYWGNVNTCGPRACYDESKRFGETLCYYFSKIYNMPVTIVRPFNNYGPGLRINDKRVVADFANAVINNEDIIIYSDGRPTRTFGYISDMTVGFIKCALYNEFEIFNIGTDKNEISIHKLAELYKKIGNQLFGYKGGIVCQTHGDKEYLTDNPNRRCPDISKSRKLLEYNPKIDLEEGIKRYLTFLKDCKREEIEW